MSERNDDPELEGPINGCKTRKVSLGPVFAEEMKNRNNFGGSGFMVQTITRT